MPSYHFTRLDSLIATVFAHVSCSDIEASVPWYEKLFRVPGAPFVPSNPSQMPRVQRRSPAQFREGTGSARKQSVTKITMIVYLAGIRFAFAPEGISSSSHCPCGPRTNLTGGSVSPRGKNDSADSGTNSVRGRSPGGYPQSWPSSRATRNWTPLNCPLNSNVPAYFASSAAGSVTAFLVSPLSAG